MEIKMTIKSCIECPYHKVINDPDPDDWFCDDDMAIVCTKIKNDEVGKFRSPAHYQKEYKVISSGLRPYEVKRMDWIPDFCPENT